MEMKDHNICNQYYKDVLTSIEMNFTFHLPYGWCVSFPNIQGIEGPESICVLPIIQYPKTPEKYKAEIEQFYRDLNNRYKD